MNYKMTQGQANLLDNLNALCRAVADAPVMRSILDDAWFHAVENNIQSGSSPLTTPADPSGFLYDFCHPLCGVDWFERNQQLVFAGRPNEVSDDGRFSIAFAGFDPLKTMFPLIERRLSAFAALPFKQATVQTKLNELRAAKLAPSFKNHLFELNVLGDLALRGILVDIGFARSR